MCRAPLNRAAMPELAFLHSVPNSTKTSKAIAGRMKAEGVERGVFDILWDLRRGGWSGLRIEGKKSKTQGRASKEQKAFAAFYASQGFLAVRANDEHEAWDIVCWYYSLPPMPVAATRHPLPARLAHAAFPTVHVSRPKRPTAPRGAK